MSGGKMYFVEGINGILKGRLYDPATGWAAEQTVSTTNGADSEALSAVNYNDEIHVAFTQAVTFDFIHTYRNATTGIWQAETNIMDDGLAATVVPVLVSDTVNNCIVCLWGDTPVTEHIYYKFYINNVWDAVATDWITETLPVVTVNNRTSSSYTATSVVGNPSFITFIYKLTEGPSGTSTRFLSLSLMNSETANVLVGCLVSGIRNIIKDAAVILGIMVTALKTSIRIATSMVGITVTTYRHAFGYYTVKFYNMLKKTVGFK
jgi:hypothetical protein